MKKMCGRLTQYASWAELRGYYELLDADDAPEAEPAYNLSRLRTIRVIRSNDGQTHISPMLWELVPSWWKQPLKEKKFSTFNARVERMTEAKSFAPSWIADQRCIIPANGFFEWPQPKKRGQAPFYIQPNGEPFLSMAGLWSAWIDPETGEIINTCTILTVPANKFMADIPHPRSPVILNPAQRKIWLDGSKEEAFALLAPPPEDAMIKYLVSSYVNNGGHEGPECIEEVKTLF